MLKGMINPNIDKVVSPTRNKFEIVSYAASRAHQITDYYGDLYAGTVFENIGPVVEADVLDKSLSVALEEIAENKLEYFDKKPVSVKAQEFDEGDEADDIAVEAV